MAEGRSGIAGRVSECIHRVEVAQVKNRMLGAAEGHYIIMLFRHVLATCYCAARVTAC